MTSVERQIWIRKHFHFLLLLFQTQHRSSRRKGREAWNWRRWRQTPRGDEGEDGGGDGEGDEDWPKGGAEAGDDLRAVTSA